MKAIFVIAAMLYSMACFADVSVTGTGPAAEPVSIETMLSKAKDSLFPALNYLAVPANHPEAARVEGVVSRLQAVSGGLWHVYVLSDNPAYPSTIREITAASRGISWSSTSVFPRSCRTTR